MLNVKQQKDLETYFSPKLLIGDYLPNPKTVSDGQPFYLKASDGIYVEHIMFKGKWHKKVIDSISQVTLEEI